MLLGLALVQAPAAVAGAPVTPPTVQFDAGTSDWSPLATRTIPREVIGGAGGEVVETRVDGQLVNASTAPSVTVQLAEGVHEIAMRTADDGAGPGPATTASVRVDATAPPASITGPTVVDEGRAFRLEATTSDALSGIGGLTWRVDGQIVATSAAYDATLPLGEHLVVLTVVDAAGNGTTVTRTVRVQAPALPPSVPQPAPPAGGGGGAWWPVPSGEATTPPLPSTTTRALRIRMQARRTGSTITVTGTVTPASLGEVALVLALDDGRAVRASAPLRAGAFEATLRAPAAVRGRLEATVRAVDGRTASTSRWVPATERAGDDAPRNTGYALCANIKAGEQCGPGNGRQTPGGGEKVSHKGWPAITGVLWKVLDSGNHSGSGGPDNDELLGHHGNDRLRGKGGKDVLWGDWDPVDNTTRQVDVLDGGAGNDWLYSSHGHNTIRAGAGKDLVWAYYGRGTIDCGPGFDTVRVRLTGSGYRHRNCERIKNFCAHGSKPGNAGGCYKPGERPRR